MRWDLATYLSASESTLLGAAQGYVRHGRVATDFACDPALRSAPRKSHMRTNSRMLGA